MPLTRVSNRLHIVFSTKERYPYIADEVRPRLLSYLGGIVRNLKSEPIAIGGTRDQVHLLINSVYRGCVYICTEGQGEFVKMVKRDDWIAQLRVAGRLRGI